MKRILPIFLVLGLFLAGSSAFAGTIDTADQITLEPSGANAISLDPTGGGAFNVVFNSTAAGNAVGQGTLSGSGFYSILQSGATVSSAGNGCGVPATCVLLSQSSPLTFNYGSTKGGNDLLSGNLTLVDITQSGRTGTFNDQLVVNLTNLTGSLAGDFGTGGGIVQMTIDFSGNVDLLAGLFTKVNATIHTGSVNPAIPEPTPLLMLGTGLISLAGLVRSKWFRSVA